MAAKVVLCCTSARGVEKKHHARRLGLGEWDEKEHLAWRKLLTHFFSKPSMLAKLKSLQNSQFLQAGFQKARLLLSQHAFLETGPRMLLSFMLDDKQVATVDIDFSNERKGPASGLGIASAVSVHEGNLAAFLDKVNITIELDAKGRPDALRWSHLFCYFDPEDNPSSLSDTMSKTIPDFQWNRAVLIVFSLSETHQIIIERGDRQAWLVYFTDEQKNPNYLQELLRQRDPLQVYQIF